MDSQWCKIYKNELDFDANTFEPKVVLSAHTGTCVICFGTQHLININAGIKQEDGNASCVQMIMKCFHIKILDSSGAGVLCKACILRLKDAILFRSQVETIGTLFTTIPIEVDVSSDTKTHPTDKRSKFSKTHAKNNEIRENVNMDLNPSVIHIQSDDDLGLQNIGIETYSGEVSQSPNTEIFNSEELLSSETKSTIVENKEAKRIEWLDQKQFPECNDLKLYSDKSNDFVCEVCGKAINSKYKLKLHMEKHANIKYPCSQCERTYSNTSSLQQHVKVSHENKMLYSCPDCAEKFANSFIRKEHMLKNHGVMYDLFPCPHCNKNTYSAGRLDTHVRRNHLKEKKFSCPECGDLFFSNFELSRHAIKHSDVRNFKCELCSKRFKIKKHLQTHLKIHLNIRDHVCSVCGKDFMQWASLRLHMKTHHKDQLAAQLSSKIKPTE